ncbi:tRNA sulfurtransferase [Candidatus Tiddalikarchaeum anstoanum]|nr:tRNA sulfurtransferase [Candidatus Tiddalikarchaeum anstoanum]
MKRCVILRYDEIGLKTKFVRYNFEKILIKNIKHFIPLTDEEVVIKRSRILIYTDDNEALARKVSKVFGLTSASPAFELTPDIELIKETALKLYKKGSFRISTQRADKDFPLKSQELNSVVGSYIVEKTNAKVDLEHYDTNIGIELFNNKAYMFNDIFRGFGGLPSGSQGQALCILDSEDSILAGLMIMNRGCNLLCIGSRKYFDKLKEINNSGPIGFKEELNDREKFFAVVMGKKLADYKSFPNDKAKFKVPVFYPLVGVETSDIKKKYNLV